MYQYDPELEAVTPTVGEVADDMGGDRSPARRQGLQAAEPDPTADEKQIQWTPEHELRLAILQDAIDCFHFQLKRPRQNPEILARQAEFWLSLDDWNSPFSFNNICEALGLDPEATRDQIVARRAEIDRQH